MNVYPCSDLQQLDICINQLNKSLISYRWTEYDSKEHTAELIGFIEMSGLTYKYLKKLLFMHLSEWEFSIIIEMIHNSEGKVVKSNAFSFYSFFSRIHTYILYYVMEKDSIWLKNLIHELYHKSDTLGLKSLYQYFVNAYINVDYVEYIDLCHYAFYEIFKLIEKKNIIFNDLLNNNYAVLYILKDYVDLPDTKQLLISKKYKEYTTNVFDALERIFKTGVDNIIYKLQYERIIKMLHILNSEKMQSRRNKDPNLFNTIKSYIINIFSCKYCLQYDDYMIFLSEFIFRKRYISKILQQLSLEYIDTYFALLNTLCKNNNIKGIFRIEINLIKQQQILACNFLFS